MMSHPNGNWTNTKYEDTAHDPTVEVVLQAPWKIETNEKLYTSYTFCDDRYEQYRTPKLFDTMDSSSNCRNDGASLAIWLWSEWNWARRWTARPVDQESSCKGRRYRVLQWQLGRLHNLAEQMETHDPQMPESEWRTIKRSYNTFRKAIRYIRPWRIC